MDFSAGKSHYLCIGDSQAALRIADACSDPQRLLAALGHAVIATDLTGTVCFWNPAAEVLYGWKSAEAVGRSINELTVPEVSEALADEIMSALRTGHPWSGGFTVRRKDGSTFPALVTDTGVYDGEALVGLVGVSIDLGQVLRPLVEQSSDAALVLIGDARIAFMSPATTRMFGWTEEGWLGRPLAESVHPDDRAAFATYHERVAADGHPAEPIECRVRRSDDTWCWTELVLTNPLGDRAVRGCICNLRDITERRRDREQLVKLTQQLQMALTTRVLIEQAKGIIAQSQGVGVDEAFNLLRRHARAHNARIHDVAHAVVNLGLRL